MFGITDICQDKLYENEFIAHNYLFNQFPEET